MFVLTQGTFFPPISAFKSHELLYLYSDYKQNDNKDGNQIPSIAISDGYAYYNKVW